MIGTVAVVPNSYACKSLVNIIKLDHNLTLNLMYHALFLLLFLIPFEYFYASLGHEDSPLLSQSHGPVWERGWWVYSQGTLLSLLSWVSLCPNDWLIWIFKFYFILIFWIGNTFSRLQIQSKMKGAHGDVSTHPISHLPCPVILYLPSVSILCSLLPTQPRSCPLECID